MNLLVGHQTENFNTGINENQCYEFYRKNKNKALASFNPLTRDVTFHMGGTYVILLEDLYHLNYTQRKIVNLTTETLKELLQLINSLPIKVPNNVVIKEKYASIQDHINNVVPVSKRELRRREKIKEIFPQLENEKYSLPEILEKIDKVTGEIKHSIRFYFMQHGTPHALVYHNPELNKISDITARKEGYIKLRSDYTNKLRNGWNPFTK
jgi:hypothetical protein